MLNQVNLMGRLTQDPILRQTETGRAVANITLACGKNYKNAQGVQGVDYIDATAWDGLAHILNEYGKKGDMLVVSGHLSQKSRRDTVGNNLRVLVLTADKVFFSGRPVPRQENGAGDIYCAEQGDR